MANARPDRYLIRNASLRIEADDVRAAAESVTKATTKAGGYVARVRESTDGLGRRSADVQLRVPSATLDTALAQIEELGKVTSKEITAEDVTEEYVDIDSRLRNLKRMEERLLGHLDQSGTMEDLLTVEKELSRQREQIERLEGRLRFLSHRVDFSTIQLTISETPSVGPLRAAGDLHHGASVLRGQPFARGIRPAPVGRGRVGRRVGRGLGTRRSHCVGRVSALQKERRVAKKDRF